MKVSKGDSIIELTAEEGNWLLDPASDVPPEELAAGDGLTYKNFRDKVEHIASEVYYANQLTVMIYVGDGDDPAATYNEGGLVFDRMPGETAAGA